VLAIGPGRWGRNKRIPVDVDGGNRVLFGRYAGIEIMLETGKILILKENDILAVVNGNDS
jgi:chaperonin GroES